MPESKVQFRVLLVWVLFRIAVGATLNIASSAASFGAAGSLRLDVPLTTRLSTLAVTVSAVSTSVTVRLPLALRPASVSARAAVSGPPVITGASFVPLIVMTTVWSSKAALSSVARTV